MAIPKIIGAQRDFSSGELDESMKRADETSVMKTGARQLVNFRILSGGQATNRPGRSVLFLESGRIEQVSMSPGQVFFLAFGNGYLRVYNAIGTMVFESHVKGDGSTGLPWTAVNANTIVFAVVPLPEPQVYITYGQDFPNNVPQVLTWDGVSQTSTWTLTTYAEAILATGQKRTIFDRISQPSITIWPQGITGVINLVASAPVFQPGWVGCHLLWCGRELLLLTYNGPMNMTAQVIEQLPNAVSMTIGQFIDVGSSNQAFIPNVSGQFVIGDLVEGATSGARGIVVSTGTTMGIGGTAQSPFPAQFQTVGVQIIPTTSTQAPVPYFLPGTIGQSFYFQWMEFIVGPNGNAQVGSTGLTPPAPVSVWDDEIMNNYRGWPKSCFYDQNRLGFCNFAVQPNAIGWSGIGLPTDFYVNGLATQLNADNAIYEKAPGGGSLVYFVIPGMEASEFVFCDNAIYYIPITSALPLTPGSVAFNLLSSQGSYPNIQPKQIQQSILYVRSGGASLGAVQTPGYYFRPNIVDLVSEFHSHLFTAAAPVAIAVPSGVTQFEESYAYLLRADGQVIMTKYLIKSGLIEAGPEGKPKMGWLLWNGDGNVDWISADKGQIIFTTRYSVTGDPWSNGWSNGFGGGSTQSVNVVEILDPTQSLDAAVYVNAAPASLVPPGGKGPLWIYAGEIVQLMDGGRPMSVYQVDVNGNIVPQFLDGENLTSPTLIAGFSWTATLEPFVPDAPPGQAAGQRMSKRRVARMTTYVSNSTGFMMGRLFSGPITPTSPALGTLMNFNRIPAWNQGDIVTNPPPLREGAYRWRPLGRSFDPRMAVVKDSPGPLLVHELGFEISV